MIGIYKITNPKNSVYIGQSWILEKRLADYKYASRCKSQPGIYRSLKKYGYEFHKIEIIHELPIDVTQEVLNKYEIFYWMQYKDCGYKMLNIREPSSRGRHSEESKNKMSIAHKGKPSSNLGVPCSESTKEKLRLVKIGKPTWIKGVIGLKQKIVECPICYQKGGLSNMKRWHFDNCKLKT